MSPQPNTAAGYCIRITYGEVVQFLTSVAEQSAEFNRLASIGLLTLVWPNLAEQCSAASATILNVATPLLKEMTRQGLRLPHVPGRPADDAVLQLQLNVGQLHLLAELGPLCIDTWQSFIDYLQEQGVSGAEVAEMKRQRQNCIEGSAGLLAAIAEAGVPDISDLLADII
jgi:hypothetical protein